MQVAPRMTRNPSRLRWWLRKWKRHSGVFPQWIRELLGIFSQYDLEDYVDRLESILAPRPITV